MQFENANNKPAVAAWAGGSVFAIFFAEWLIHKPGLNIVRMALLISSSFTQLKAHSNSAVLQLLGFPIQLFGLLLLPGTIVKYLVEKDDPAEDVRSAVV